MSLIFSYNPARPWLQIIVSSCHSPGRGAVESWYLVRWLFHFLPRAGAEVFTLFPLRSQTLQSMARWLTPGTRAEEVPHPPWSFCGSVY